MQVILFEFAGRRPNMELHLPFLHRILQQHPNVDVHLWNMARNPDDANYIRTLNTPRIHILEDLYNKDHGRRAWNQVYRHYTTPEYADTLFVKLDDDIVFIETHRFGAFLDTIHTYPGTIISANTINNGACTPLIPGLWPQFTKLGESLDLIHTSNRYAHTAHTHFFNNYPQILGQPLTLHPTKDWLSINLIGYNPDAAHTIAQRVGEIPHPPLICGRRFPLPWGMGDEGVTNLMPRIIVQGFTACHLTFGPQHTNSDEETRWRAEYKLIGHEYLTNPAYAVTDQTPLPGLSPTSWAWKGEDIPENNPRAGRFNG